MGFKFECLGGPWGLCPRTIFFQNMAMLHTKAKGIKCATCEQIVCPYTHLQSLGWGLKVKTVFSESDHVAYQIKGNDA